MRLLMCFEEFITEIGQIKNMVCSLEKNSRFADARFQSISTTAQPVVYK